MEVPQEPKTNVVLLCGNIGTGCIPTPQEVSGFHDTVVSIASSPSAQHSLFICADGKCYAMGRNPHGQLGQGDASPSFAPVLINALEKHVIVKGAVGRHHSLFLSDAGVVFGCGKNDLGEVGTANKKNGPFDVYSPIEIIALKGREIVEISCGATFSMAVDKEGAVWSWGSAENGCTGRNTDGKQIGKGKATFAVHMPNKITTLPGINIKKIVCGVSHTVTLTDTGDVYTWGFGGYGRLGHKQQVDEFKPRKIEMKIFYPVTDIACGSQYNLAVGAYGMLYSWGKIKSGGDSIMYPTQERDLMGWKIAQISCGGSSALVVADGTNTIAWGNAGIDGELGFGPEQKSSARPKIVESLKEIVVKQLSCGNTHTFFLAEKNEHTDKFEKFVPPTVVVATEEEPPKKKQKTKK
jgi:alpha-tubulin suppressor-like RCC1 family protein